MRVDWNKVRIGINKVINNLLDSRKEGQQVHTIIGADNKEDFTEEEWKTYQSIEEFQTGNLLMFSNNKKLYVEEMQENAMTALLYAKIRGLMCLMWKWQLLLQKHMLKGIISINISFHIISIKCGKEILYRQI